MKEAAQILRDKGLKVTPQRIAIYTMLMGTKAHPSAETIYRSLEATNPTMSLATVYKTLDSLQGVQLVQELNVGDGCSRYDAETRSHPHFICKTCGEVFDFPITVLTKELKSHIQDQTDYRIDSAQVFFYGECPACQKDAVCDG